jgi:hypothetical protein
VPGFVSLIARMGTFNRRYSGKKSFNMGATESFEFGAKRQSDLPVTR